MSESLPSPAPSRSEAVLDALRGALLSGDLAPGERLHEVRLTEWLGVSRTPIRAALQALASEGLLDHAPQRGYRVRAFPLDEIVAAYDVRAVLEGLAARVATERGLDDRRRALLENALADGDRLIQEGALREGDRATYGVVNSTFHETIHAAGGSRLLGDALHRCRQVPVSSPHNIVAFELPDVRRRHDDHHRIYEAIVAGEPWRAEMLMRDHVASVKRSLVRSLAGSADMSPASAAGAPPQRKPGGPRA